MSFSHALLAILTLLAPSLLTQTCRADTLLEGTPECRGLATYLAPVTSESAADTTFLSIRNGMGYVRNRYNTGESCAYIQRGQVRLWYQIAPALSDSTNAPWIIFVNGGPGYATGFRDAQFLKLRDKYNLAWFNQRGTGLSPLTLAQSSDCKTANISQNVQDLRALQQWLSPNMPVVLLAHSFGGILAQEFAAQFPESTHALIMSGTDFGFDFVRQAILNGNTSLFPYQDFVSQVLRNASPDVIERYVSAEKIVASKLKDGIPVVLSPNLSSDTMHEPQFIVTIKKFFADSNFDAVTATQFMEDLESGQHSANELAALGFDSAGTNNVLRTTILCSDGLPAILSSLPKKLAERLTRGCNQITAGCKNEPIDFEALPSRISAPTLILAGTSDEKSPVEDQRRLSTKIANAQFVALPDADHDAIMELNFDAFPAILVFLGVPANWTAETWQKELR